MSKQQTTGNKKMKKVWIVVGYTGAYSDYVEWKVAGYTSEEEAEKHKSYAGKEAYKLKDKPYQTRIREGLKNPYDSQFRMDYTGTNYRVDMVEVHESFNP